MRDDGWCSVALMGMTIDFTARLTKSQLMAVANYYTQPEAWRLDQATEYNPVFFNAVENLDKVQRRALADMGEVSFPLTLDVWPDGDVFMVEFSSRVSNKSDRGVENVNRKLDAIIEAVQWHLGPNKIVILTRGTD